MGRIELLESVVEQQEEAYEKLINDYYALEERYLTAVEALKIAWAFMPNEHTQWDKIHNALKEIGELNGNGKN